MCCSQSNDRDGAALYRRDIDACAQVSCQAFYLKLVSHSRRSTNTFDDNCASPLQRADVEGALAVFQRAKSQVLPHDSCAFVKGVFLTTHHRSLCVPLHFQDVALQIHSYNVLLHLCAGGNQAEDSTKRVFSPQSAEVRPSCLRPFLPPPISSTPWPHTHLRHARCLST